MNRSALLSIIAAAILIVSGNIASAAPANVTNAWMIQSTVQACGLAPAVNVQNDVGLSAAQGKKLLLLHETWEKKMKDFLKANRRPTDKQLSDLDRELTADILKTITADQLMRLRQIQFQCDGPAKVVAMHPDTAILFGLKPPEAGSILALEMKYQRQLAEASFQKIPLGVANRETDPPEIVTIRQNRNSEALSLMTPPQRAAWEKLRGKPFAGSLRDASGKRVHPKVISLP